MGIIDLCVCLRFPCSYLLRLHTHFLNICPCQVDDFVAKAKELRVGRGTDPESSLGPVISGEAKSKIEGIIERASKQGAKVSHHFVHVTRHNVLRFQVALDGRGLKVAGLPNGNWVRFRRLVFSLLC
jgi:hypothetical protein